MVKLVADVASYQPDTLEFFQALKAGGVDAVVVKLTEGSNPGSAYLNPKARNQINNARAAGLLVHAYHYARFNGADDARAEADWFVKCARDLGIGPDSVMALDAEDDDLQYHVTDDCNAFIQAVKDAGYPNTDIYVMASWVWSGRIDLDKIISKNRWIASYGASQPGVDNVGTWQFRSDYPIAGIEMDMSYDFSGFYTNEKIAASSPTVTETPAPAPVAVPSSWVDELGVTWYKEDGTFTLDTAINLRWGATTQSSVIAQLPAGSSVNYDAFCYSGDYVWIRQPRGNGQYGYLATGNAVNGKRTDYWGKFE